MTPGALLELSDFHGFTTEPYRFDTNHTAVTSSCTDSNHHGASPAQLRDKMEPPHCHISFSPNFKLSRVLNYRQSDLQEALIRHPWKFAEELTLWGPQLFIFRSKSGELLEIDSFPPRYIYLGSWETIRFGEKKLGTVGDALISYIVIIWVCICVCLCIVDILLLSLYIYGGLWLYIWYSCHYIDIIVLNISNMFFRAFLVVNLWRMHMWGWRWNPYSCTSFTHSLDDWSPQDGFMCTREI